MGIIGEECANENDILFNAKKSMCIILKANYMTEMSFLSIFYLCGNLWEFVSEFRYILDIGVDDLTNLMFLIV